MRLINRHYINGQFVEATGDAEHPVFDPSTEAQIGVVRLGGVEDARIAIAAARDAAPGLAALSVADRSTLLHRLKSAVEQRTDALVEAMVEEYGAPVTFARGALKFAAESFFDAAEVMEAYAFERRVGETVVTMASVGVVGAITPWNSNAGFICSKAAMAIAAGCPIVVKPSEMSASQTDVLLDAIHAADLPPGVFNLVNGSGEVVGAELTTHPEVAKLTFTGSTATGQAIMRGGAGTMKRLTLELGGKSANIILDDADLEAVAHRVVQVGLTNSGQACHAGTRILVPEHLVEEATGRICAALADLKVGDPRDPSTAIGPMVSQAQFDRVQRYIRLGQTEGAQIAAGGEGRPAGLDYGWFVRPTLFVGATNRMRVAREEIFGPVLSLIPYRDDEDAIAIANDSAYGLQAYVHTPDLDRARRMANRLQVGRVLINGTPPDRKSPFGGFKHSGLGREFGVFGLESFLEPRAVSGGPA